MQHLILSQRFELLLKFLIVLAGAKMPPRSSCKASALDLFSPSKRQQSIPPLCGPHWRCSERLRWRDEGPCGYTIRGRRWSIRRIGGVSRRARRCALRALLEVGVGARIRKAAFRPFGKRLRFARPSGFRTCAVACRRVNGDSHDFFEVVVARRRVLFDRRATAGSSRAGATRLAAAANQNHAPWSRTSAPVRVGWAGISTLIEAGGQRFPV